jgi:S1-C subfamily serine protease
MTGADLIVIVWISLSALIGFRRGFAAQALSLAGFAAGAWIGSRLAPHALSDSARDDWKPVAALVGAVVGGALAQAATSPVGAMARRRMVGGPLALIDEAGGLITGAVLGLAVVWLVAVTAINQPSLGLRHEVQTSTILPRLVRWLPAQSLIDAIARFDQLPVLGVGGVADLPPPDRSVPVSEAVRRAERSVLMIEGSSCGLTLQGSGWVVRPGLVVTNAHVIAGEHSTRVVTPTGTLEARPVYVDAGTDIALLQVAGLQERPLRVRTRASAGAGVALVGYPGGGPLTAAPGRVGRPAFIVTRDAYGRGVTQRTVIPIRGNVLHGDSGGPAVDRGGRVVAMMFAATETGGGGFGVSMSDVEQALASPHPRHVDTGPCVS